MGARKKVHLSNVGGDGTVRENAGTVAKHAGTKPRTVTNYNENLHCRRTNEDGRGTYNFCGVKGHLESPCFKKILTSTQMVIE